MPLRVYCQSTLAVLFLFLERTPYRSVPPCGVESKRHFIITTSKEHVASASGLHRRLVHDPQAEIVTNHGGKTSSSSRSTLVESSASHSVDCSGIYPSQVQITLPDRSTHNPAAHVCSQFKQIGCDITSVHPSCPYRGCPTHARHSTKVQANMAPAASMSARRSKRSTLAG